jgi:uncharacterized protein YjbI with pentapeptide repeats
VTDTSGLHRRQLRRSARGWLVVLAALAVVAGGSATTAWLLTEADQASGDQRVAERMAAVRTGLAVAGVAAGALVLLFIRYRPAGSPPDQPAPRSAPSAPGPARSSDARDAAMLDDVTERRVTELYLKAAEQLGSTRAPVRMAALYTLERLAADHPAHRQTIVDVICAYLRMPYDDPDEPATGPGARQERQVRVTAQRILARHLRSAVVGAGGDDEPNPQGWADVALDLAGATLVDFDFQRCQVRQANFTGATFLGRTSFQQATFCLAAWFGEARFTGVAEFHDVTFQRGAWFREATFGSSAGFGHAVFAGAGDAVFERASFNGHADFGGAVAHSNAVFLHAQFHRGVHFRDTTFYGAAYFSGITVDGQADADRAVFDRASFFAGAFFGGATFRTDVVFDGARFLAGADFAGGTIAAAARFDKVQAIPDTAALGLAQVSVLASRNGHVWPSGWRPGVRGEDGANSLTYGVAWDQPTQESPEPALERAEDDRGSPPADHSGSPPAKAGGDPQENDAHPGD